MGIQILNVPVSVMSDLHVSQSHMYRLIKKSQSNIKEISLSIYSNEENIVELAGRELDIRIFIL